MRWEEVLYLEFIVLAATDEHRSNNGTREPS